MKGHCSGVFSMKQSWFIVILLLFIFLSLTISAKAITSGKFEYTLNNDGTVTITKCNYDPYKLSIPSELAGKTVTGIAKDAFSSCKNVTGIIIPDSIINIYSDVNYKDNFRYKIENNN